MRGRKMSGRRGEDAERALNNGNEFVRTGRRHGDRARGDRLSSSLCLRFLRFLLFPPLPHFFSASSSFLRFVSSLPFRVNICFSTSGGLFDIFSRSENAFFEESLREITSKNSFEESPRGIPSRNRFVDARKCQEK